MPSGAVPGRLGLSGDTITVARQLDLFHELPDQIHGTAESLSHLALGFRSTWEVRTSACECPTIS